MRLFFLFLIFLISSGCSSKNVNKSRSYFKDETRLNKTKFLKNIDNEIKSILKEGEKYSDSDSDESSESSFDAIDERLKRELENDAI